jgi:hypothetical protein
MEKDSMDHTALVKQHGEDIMYLIEEIQTLLTHYKNELPEDLYKTLKDYSYHIGVITKEVKYIYVKDLQSWNSCSSNLQHL